MIEIDELAKWKDRATRCLRVTINGSTLLAIIEELEGAEAAYKQARAECIIALRKIGQQLP